MVLKEIGPRAELKLYQIKQGTLDKEATANTEWRMHPYMNTAKKRRFLWIEFEWNNKRTDREWNILSLNDI